MNDQEQLNAKEGGRDLIEGFAPGVILRDYK